MSKKEASSNVFNILAFTFEGKDTAKQTVKEVRSSGALDDQLVVAQVLVRKNKKGKVKVSETGRGGLGAVVGAVEGGLLSLIGGPYGFLTWVATGAVVGGIAGKYFGRPIKKGDLKEIGKAMPDDSSAFLLLVEDIYSEVVADSLSGVSANVVTLTVGDELSGEIAQYVAASVDVDDDAGDDTDDDSEDDN
jgi:uncharacterized membrane protein